ncbi:hypothetical protein D9758_006570 [Tetrapyrgos nigripes]|uniref:Elongation factor 1-beta n=1 Tax=Tetrapyrgos nigripes TaxID=182062 RepID=A0A8H5GL65_9AGAR|nr:hypothetical protein D9758_006570 [Tetrapyrgos nigripes]
MSVDLAKLDKHLASRSYVEGYTPSQADVHVFNAIKSEPTSNPNVARWYKHIKSYSAEFSSLPGSSKAGEAFLGGSAAPAAAEGGDDEDIDLFGEDEEEDAEAERIKAERVAAYNAKKANKPKTIAKSVVTLEVKPWDDETDMDALEKSVRSLEKDGLVWGSSKLVAIGYGIKKLQITLVIEDEKISMDELQEEIQGFEDYVQSTDVAAMQSSYCFVVNLKAYLLICAAVTRAVKLIFGGHSNIASVHIAGQVDHSNVVLLKVNPISSDDTSRCVKLVGPVNGYAQFLFRTLKLRVRRHDLSRETLKTDLGTAMRMLLENDGLNEGYLGSIGFLQFVIGHLERCVEDNKLNQQCGDVPADDSNHLAIELLVLILSREYIVNFSPTTRERLLLVSRPFIISALQQSAFAKSPHVSLDVPVSENDKTLFRHGPGYGTLASIYEPKFRLWQDASAALILTFALKELDIPQIPPHLPLDRTTAAATGRSGPTQQDYQIVANYRTPLFGDNRPAAQRTGDSSRSASHGAGLCIVWEDFRLKTPDVPGSEVKGYAYTFLPCLLTGVWEGIYMILPSAQLERSGSTADLAITSAPDFLCRTPMQCSLSLYFCFDTQEPGSQESTSDIECCANSTQIIESEDRLTVTGRKYEKLILDPSNGRAVKDPSQATDCIIIGQTLAEHEQAWGAYRYVGRLSRDGEIILRREPKNSSDEGFGNWIFEGRLRLGMNFVGVWRSGEPGECAVRGIFGLRKTGD